MARTPQLLSAYRASHPTLKLFVGFKASETNLRRKRLPASIRLNPLSKCISFTFQWLQSLWGDLLAACLKAPVNPHSGCIWYRHQMKRLLIYLSRFTLNPAPVLGRDTSWRPSQSRHCGSSSDFHSSSSWIWCEALCDLWLRTWVLLVTVLVYPGCIFRSPERTSFCLYLTPRPSQSSSTPSNFYQVQPNPGKRQKAQWVRWWMIECSWLKKSC